MNSQGDEAVPLPPNTHYEPPAAPDQAQYDPDVVQAIRLTNTNDSSSSSSYNDGEEKPRRPQYGAIRNRTTYRDDTYREEELQRTISQMYGGINEEDREKLRQIASLRRSKTGSSSKPSLQRGDTLAGVSDDDPRLNPESPEFDVYVWSRALLRAMDEEQIKAAKSGFTFKNLNVSGSGAALSLQQDFASPIIAPFRFGEFFDIGHKPHKRILRNFDGIVKSGEMLIVLGRPGSGCSTLLKTICGELTGLELDSGSTIHYNGIPQANMIKEFKGEVVYNQEVDKHFPHLTVGETLEFAAAARTPHQRVKGITRQQGIHHFTQVVMTVFGLGHTRNTKVWKWPSPKFDVVAHKS